MVSLMPGYHHEVFKYAPKQTKTWRSIVVAYDRSGVYDISLRVYLNAYTHAEKRCYR